MRRRRYLAMAAGAVAGVSAAGCAADTPPESDGDGRNPSGEEAQAAIDSPLDADVTATVAMENLELPWDVAFTDDGEVFLTERVGRIRRGAADVLVDGEGVEPDALEVEPVDLPGFVANWEAGAQGIALHPDYPDVPYVYVYYTVGDRDQDAEEHFNRVVRYDATAESPEVEVIVDDIAGSHIHNGGRIAFGPEDHLWVLTGTGGQQELARDPSSRGGAVLRVTPDGEPAGADIDGGDPRTFTYGHRNPQGIDWLDDGTPVVAEHGPAQRDEFHLLEAGEDYGWNVARGGDDDPDYESYHDHDFARPVAASGLEDTWAPSGGSLYDADAIPEWEGRFLLAGLVSHRLYIFTLLDGDEAPPDDATEIHDDDWLDDRYRVVQHERFVDEYGRLRHAAVGPNGEVFLLTSNTTGPIRETVEDEFPREHDDVIVRIEPA